MRFWEKPEKSRNLWVGRIDCAACAVSLLVEATNQVTAGLVTGVLSCILQESLRASQNKRITCEASNVPLKQLRGTYSPYLGFKIFHHFTNKLAEGRHQAFLREFPLYSFHSHYSWVRWLSFEGKTMNRIVKFKRNEDGTYTLCWSDLLEVKVIDSGELSSLIDKLLSHKLISGEEHRYVIRELVIEEL